MDYVSKWIEAIAFPTNDAQVVTKMFKIVIFLKFGIPRLIISDGGFHFIFDFFENLLTRYGVKHRAATLYHTQTSKHVEISNCEIKRIVEKTVSTSRRD